MVTNSSETRMRIGVIVQQAEGALDDRTPTFVDIKELTLTAEAVGFDSFWLPDHLIYRPHEPEETGVWEVFTFLSALASVTSTITLGTLVASSLFRSPAILAKMADSLDHISDGRFILGLGAGNWEAEHRMFGLPFDHRVARFEEALQIIAPLLREGRVDFHGRYYEAADCVLRPRGPSPSGPPIWVGTRGERMLRIAARHADAYNAIWPITIEQICQQKARLVAACADVGRDPATFALTAGTFVRLPQDDVPARDDRAISGTYAEIAAQLRAIEAEGVQHLCITFRPGPNRRTFEQFANVLALLR